MPPSKHTPSKSGFDLNDEQTEYLKTMGIDISTIATQAKAIALYCVRNTMLENLHSGCFPSSKTGDFSDVFVVDGNENKIPWKQLSRFNDDEMKSLMKEIVDKVAIVLLAQKREDKSSFNSLVASNALMTTSWDNPSSTENNAAPD